MVSPTREATPGGAVGARNAKRDRLMRAWHHPAIGANSCRPDPRLWKTEKQLFAREQHHGQRSLLKARWRARARRGMGDPGVLARPPVSMHSAGTVGSSCDCESPPRHAFLLSVKRACTHKSPVMSALQQTGH